MPRFGTVITAMVTPFDIDGALDLDGAAAVATHLAASGSEGLVVAGSTGEGPVLTDIERIGRASCRERVYACV
jgi:4-hydroxy-tetrahydrodipicolinate synthase